MDSTDIDRRRFLTLGGAGTIAALAGCMDVLDSGGGSGDTPAYSEDLATDEDGNVVAFYTTWEEDGFDTGGGSGGGIIGGGPNNETGGGIGGGIDGGPNNETGGGIGGGIGGGPNNETGGGIGGGIGGGPNNETGGGESMGNMQDPLLFPAASPVLVGLFAGFTLGFTPLAPVLGLSGGGLFGIGMGNQNETENEASTETEITDALMTFSGDGFAFVMNGNIDTDEVGELLGGNAGGTGLTYSETGERNGYTRYELDTDSGIGGGGSGNVTVDIDTEGLGGIAVSSDSILIGSSGALDRLTGEAGSAVDESDTLSWLLEASGDGEFGVTMHVPEGLDEAAMDGGNQSDTGGGIGGGDGGIGGGGGGIDNETQEILEQLDVTVTGISGTASEAGGGEELDVEMGMSFGSEIGSDIEETIRSEFGSSSDDVSFDFDGSRVAISGTVTGPSM
jgi:hypothetical protein